MLWGSAVIGLTAPVAPILDHGPYHVQCGGVRWLSNARCGPAHMSDSSLLDREHTGLHFNRPHGLVLSSSADTPRLLRRISTADDPMDRYLECIGRQRLLLPEEVALLSSAVQRLLRWDTARDELAERLARQPTDEEMAAALGLPSGAVYLEQVGLLRRSKHLLVRPVGNLTHQSSPHQSCAFHRSCEFTEAPVGG